MKSLTKAQREALRDVYHRHSTPSFTDGAKTWRGYRKFRATARLDTIMGCVMVPWCNMWLGIEPDGYTHS